MGACELTFMERDSIDIAAATRQHAAYEDALRALGATVVCAPTAPTLQDGVFVEDTALVLDEIAVLANMRRPSRAPETELIDMLLQTQREIVRIQSPGSLEGGDAFLVGRTVFIGLSTRTNEAGIEQLRALVEPFGYRVAPVAVTGCLHLTTGASSPAEGLALVNPDWVDARAFAEVNMLTVDPAEPWAANSLKINGTALLADCFPRTREILETHGVDTRVTDISELMKAEAGLSCMSLLFEGDAESLTAALPTTVTTAGPASSRSTAPV